MVLRLRRVPGKRWPEIPAWSLAVVGVWGSLVGVSAWLEQGSGREAQTCLFRWITGHPCPTCGSTRALLALLQGRWLEALAHNPLVVLGGGLGLGLLLHQGLTARRFRLEANPPLGPWVWWLGLGLLGINWVWVWNRS